MSTLNDVMSPRRRSWRSVQALELERRSQPTSDPLTVAYANTDWAPELKWWMSTAQPSSCRSRHLRGRTETMDETRSLSTEFHPWLRVPYLVWKGWTLGDLGGLFASTASSWMEPLSEATAK